MLAELEEKSKGDGRTASICSLGGPKSYIAASYLPIKKQTAEQPTVGWVGEIDPLCWSALCEFAPTIKHRHQVLRATLEALVLRYAGALDLEALRIRVADLIDDSMASSRLSRMQSVGAPFLVCIDGAQNSERAADPQADLTLVYLDGNSHCGWRFREGTWTNGGIERFHLQFCKMLAEILRSPAARVGELDYIPSPERELVSEAWTGVASYGLECQSTVGRFEAIAKRFADLPAVECGHKQIDYQTLNEAANRLAHYLMYFSVRPSSIVAICLPPSIEAVIAKLAVQKLGAVSLIIDPQDAEADRAKTLENCGNPLCITTGPVQGGNIVSLERDAQSIRTQSKLNPAVQIRGEHAAEIVFSLDDFSSSRSTLMLHRSVLSMVSVDAFPQPNVEESIVQTGKLGSGQASFEFWSALLNGAKLVLPMIEFGDDLAGLSAFLKKHKSKLLYIPEGRLSQWLKAGLEGLLVPETLIVGGPGLQSRAMEKLSRKRKRGNLIQAYGNAESGLLSLLKRVDDSAASREDLLPPASPGTAVYVLDPAGLPVAVGAVGELCIESSSLAWGGLSNSTVDGSGYECKHFTAASSGRYYRTGELVRWTESGRIERIGRGVQLAQLESLTVNLYEIESELRKAPHVLDCVVVVRQVAGHLKRLVAYVQMEESIVNLRRTLRDELAKSLPEHLLPSDFVEVQSLPLNRIGQIDRDALALPALGPEVSGAEADARAAESGKLRRPDPRFAKLGLWGLWKQALRKIV